MSLVYTCYIVHVTSVSLYTLHVHVACKYNMLHVQNNMVSVQLQSGGVKGVDLCFG
jgi:hypothetical protein